MTLAVVSTHSLKSVGTRVRGEESGEGARAREGVQGSISLTGILDVKLSVRPGNSMEEWDHL